MDLFYSNNMDPYETTIWNCLLNEYFYLKEQSLKF